MANRRPAPIRALPIRFVVLAALLIACLLTSHAAQAAAGDVQYRQGQAAAKSGQYATAAHDFEQAILSGHNDPNTYYQLGLAYSHLKRWNDAAWAIATAMSDPVFSATQPQASKALDAAQQAGGTNAGPPPALANATLKPMPAPRANPVQLATRESQQAFSALKQGAYFVSPGFNRQITFQSATPLSTAAEDINSNSSTSAKFAYLDATPAPYTRLSDYAHDLFSHLGLSRAVLVVVTPGAAVAYSDRLDTARTAKIAGQQWRAVGIQDPVALAANIARAVVKQADDNDAAAQRRTIAIAAAVIIVILAAVGLAIRYVARSEPRQRGGASRQSGLTARSRAR